MRAKMKVKWDNFYGKKLSFDLWFMTFFYQVQKFHMCIFILNKRVIPNKKKKKKSKEKWNED